MWCDFTKTEQIRETAYKFVAYLTISFSLVGIIVIFVTLPMANNYINNVHSRIYHEMDFCKVKLI